MDVALRSSSWRCADLFTRYGAETEETKDEEVHNVCYGSRILMFFAFLSIRGRSMIVETRCCVCLLIIRACMDCVKVLLEAAACANSKYSVTGKLFRPALFQDVYLALTAPNYTS